MNNKTISTNPSYNRLAYAAGFISAVAGFLVLIGWQYNINVLKTFGVSPVPMKPNSALAFFFAGFSLLLLNLNYKTKSLILLSKIFAAIVFWIGLLTIIEYIFQINLFIDQILFRDLPGAILTVIPGRLSFNLALGLTSAGIALLYVGKKNEFVRGLSILAAGIGVLAVFSYILGLSVLLEMVGINTIALNSAICLVILSAGIFSSASGRESEKSKIENQITIISVVIVLFIITANIVSLQINKKAGDFGVLIASSNNINEKIEHTLHLMSDVDSDFKDYIVTGNGTYIQAIDKLDSDIHTTIKNLNAVVRDPGEKFYVDSLSTLCSNMILYVKNEIADAMNKKLQPGNWNAAVQTDDALAANISYTGGKFITFESKLYEYRHNQELTAGKEAIVVQIIMMFLQFGFLVGISFIVSRDIKARTKAEKALKESEEKFRSISQSAADAIITADGKGVIIGWNGGAENIFGFTEIEIIGKKLTKIIPRHLVDQLFAGMIDIEDRSEHRVIGENVELVGLHKNGREFPIELSLSEWESSSGKYYSAIIRDISQRKQMDLERQIIYEITEGITSTSNLDELLNLMHTSLSKRLYAENCFVALYDPDTGLFSFPYFVDKFDQKPTSAALQKSCTAYVFRTQKTLLLTNEMFDRLIEEKEVELIGAPSPSWFGVPLQTPGGVIGVLVIQHYEDENVYSENDIEFLESIGSQIAVAIQRKMAEEEILRNSEKLSKLNAEKDKLFSIIAHDLRSPFTGLMSLSELMSDKSESFTIPEYLQFSKELNDSARNIYKLINNLFEWAQLQKGSIKFSPVSLNLQTIVSKQIESIILHAKKKNITILNAVPEQVQVFADDNMLSTIIRNLVSNAVKFTPAGGLVTIHSESLENGSKKISVTDTGIGMSEDQINKLFTIGEKIGSKGTEGELSTGLGLLICKEFVEIHKGEISVKSELGKGSIFTVTLPS